MHPPLSPDFPQRCRASAAGPSLVVGQSVTALGRLGMVQAEMAAPDRGEARRGKSGPGDTQRTAAAPDSNIQNADYRVCLPKWWGRLLRLHLAQVTLWPSPSRQGAARPLVARLASLLCVG